MSSIVTQPLAESAVRRWCAVAILTAAYVLSFIDRQLPAILMEPIRHELQLSDWQLGLMSGTAFALCYSLLGVPISQAADRWSRRWVIVWGIALWSLMTAASAFADRFGWLFIARMGVGLGEAALLPAAYALIAELFAPDRRASAYGLLVLGAPIGTGLSMILGGALIQTWEASAFAVWLPGLMPWRGALLVIGLTGLLLVPLAATLPEAKRPGPSGAADDSFSETWRFMRSSRSFFLPLLTAIVLWNVVAFSYITWAPSVLVRSFGYGTQEAGNILGMSFVAAGIAGCVLAPLTVTVLDRMLGRSSIMIVTSICLISFCAIVCVGAAAPKPGINTAMWACAPALLFSVSTLFPAILLANVPATHRARVAAVCLLISNFVGIGIGPAFTGFIAGWMPVSADGLRFSLALISGSGTVVAAAALARLHLRYQARPRGLASDQL